MILSLGDVISKGTHLAGRNDWTTSEASFWANLALTEVQSRLNHTPKEATALSNVTGTGNEWEIALPSDFGGILGVVFYSSTTDADSGENVLGEKVDLTIRDTEFLDSLSSTSGQPQYYALYGGVMELWPAPNSRGSLVMRYEANQQVLVLSTSTPDLDERWHPGWLDKTEELLHRSRSNHQAATEAERRYVNYMTSTPNDRSMEQSAKQGLGLRVRKY